MIRATNKTEEKSSNGLNENITHVTSNTNPTNSDTSSSVSSSNIDDNDLPPIEVRNRFNSKCMRAMSFVTNNKVKQNLTKVKILDLVPVRNARKRYPPFS
jgi:hypothetical protein